jgi:type II secretory pathway pseudopilin PulG
MLQASSRAKLDSRVQRGFSLAEALTATVIFGLVGMFVATIVPHAIGSSSKQQAKVDTVQSATKALYRLQRDLRQSDPNGIFICSVAAATTCNLASSYTTLQDAPYLAILTQHVNGTGQITWDPTGKPGWQGFNVYWLAPDGYGGSTLMSAFANAPVSPGINPVIQNADVVNAVDAALASKSAETVAASIADIQTMVLISADRVALKISARSSVGTGTNETTVESDTFARN